MREEVESKTRSKRRGSGRGGKILGRRERREKTTHCPGWSAGRFCTPRRRRRRSPTPTPTSLDPKPTIPSPFALPLSSSLPKLTFFLSFPRFSPFWLFALCVSGCGCGEVDKRGRTDACGVIVAESTGNSPSPSNRFVCKVERLNDANAHPPQIGRPNNLDPYLRVPASYP